MMIVDNAYVSCPKCDWEPSKEDIWQCDICRTKWNTFETHAKCPGCGKVFIDTQCMRSKGGCGQMTPHADWYKPVDEIKKNKKSAWFWQKKDDLPLSKPDRVWLEANLVWLVNLLGAEAIQLKHTIIPDEEYFQYHFTGAEQDATYVMQMVQKIIGLNEPEIKLMFFSQEPTNFSDGITATPSEDLSGGWNPTENDLYKNERGEFEIWIDQVYLTSPVRLIASLSRVFSKYLLYTKFNIGQQLKTRSDLASIILGFGIFRADAYFQFGQWNNTISYGWRMSKQSGSSEQEIAYAMAWLAHYRKEDVAWKSHLNGTVRAYFEKCYTFIGQNPDKVNWPA